MEFARLITAVVCLCAGVCSTAGAQGVASVLIRGEEGTGLSGSYAGELTLTADTLIFSVEAAAFHNGHNSKAAVGSLSLALGEVRPDGSWRIVHRGFDRPIDVGLTTGQRLELSDLFLGLTAQGLLQSMALRPMVILEPSAPPGARPTAAFLEESLAELFNLPGGPF